MFECELKATLPQDRIPPLFSGSFGFRSAAVGTVPQQTTEEPQMGKKKRDTKARDETSKS